MGKLKVPAAPSVMRLPSYLHLIKEAHVKGQAYISGTFIAEELELESIQVRKDLAMTGIVGVPKRGYAVDDLIKAIENFLGWNKTTKAILVGAGNLGTALSGYTGFVEHGLEIIAAFDNEKSKVGKNVHGIDVFDMDMLQSIISNVKPTLAVLTISSDSAQEVADVLVENGIKAIWNFTKTKLTVPKGVAVRQEDLSSGYALLCTMMNLVK